MARKKHVVFYSAALLDTGGIERNLLQIVEMLQGDYQFSLVGYFSPAFQARMEAAGAACYFRPIPAAFSWRAIRELAAFLKNDLHADLIHTIDPRGSTIGSPAGCLARIPTVHRHSVSPLDYQSGWRRQFIYSAGEALLSWLCIDRGIFVAESVRQHYVRLGLAPWWRSHYIPNSVALTAYDQIRQGANRTAWAIPDETFLWVNLGRLEEQKAQDVLVAAAAHLRDVPKWMLLIAGGGSLETALTQQIDHLDLHEQVRLLGSLPHAQALQLLACADCLVFPSRYENMPNTVLEAMALQIPAIVTDVGDSWWMSGAGALPPASLLVPKNDAAALAAAMKKLMQEPDLRRQLAQAGTARVADFTPERTIQQTAALYQQLLIKEA